MAEELQAEDVRKTYRYLRIGMIGAVVLLATSIVVERSKVDCWQTSISAYYYTPVRAIFVGSMIAVGLSLIVYKGRGGWEDFFLNFAGMLAPVVAIAPTTDAERQCWSFPPTSFPIQDGSVAEWVTTNIDNNFYALLIAGGIGLTVAAIIAIFVNRRSGVRSVLAPFEKGDRGTRLGLTVTALALLFGWWLIENWSDFNRLAHGYAAVGMFGFLIAAILANVFEQFEQRETRWSWGYAAIAAFMILGGIVIPWFRIGHEYTVGVLEAYEIVLFAVYWIAQTRENWHEDVGEGREPKVASVGTIAWADKRGGELSFSDKFALLVVQGVPTRVDDFVARALGRLRRANSSVDRTLANTFAHAVVDQKPSTAIARRAEAYCNDVSDDWLVAHCYRTYAYGAWLGRSFPADWAGWEVLFVASMLHDIGLTEDFREGSETVLSYARRDKPCFAVRGAGVAESLATTYGWGINQSRVLAEAISLHLNVRVGPYRGLEAHLLNAASAFDVIRLGEHRVPDEIRRSVEMRWPRDDSFCRDISAAWMNEAKSHQRCRAAFLNKWGSFQRRIRNTCPSSEGVDRRAGERAPDHSSASDDPDSGDARP